MVWKDEYRIGVEHIDGQHQNLFAKTGEFESIVNSGVAENKQAVIDIIVFLKGYALNHFADEENYSKSIDYADFNEHQSQHKAFIQTLLQQEKALKNSDFSTETVEKLLQTLKVWLLFHVTNSDRRIVGKPPIIHDTVG